MATKKSVSKPKSGEKPSASRSVKPAGGAKTAHKSASAKSAASTAKPGATPKPKTTSAPVKAASAIGGVTAPKSKSGDSAKPVEKALDRKDLLARIEMRTGLKRNNARAVVDAVLDEIGDALLRGEKLKLPPLGVVSVNRHKERDNAHIIVCKIRRKKKSDSTRDPLAPAAE